MNLIFNLAVTEHFLDLGLKLLRPASYLHYATDTLLNQPFSVRVWITRPRYLTFMVNMTSLKTKLPCGAEVWGYKPMTFISFSDPIAMFQLVCAVGVTSAVPFLLLFDRTAGRPARNLMVSATIGMWSLFCLFEALVAIHWPWMTGFYLFGIASAYFGYRMLHWFFLGRPPAWEARFLPRKWRFII